MTERLYFSIGPVQGFIAAARRTRDLWAGSWLLSHLAEQAVNTIKANSRLTLVLPQAPVRDVKQQHDDAAIAGTPNRLIAEGPLDALREAAVNADRAVRERWQSIADKVWEQSALPAVRAINSDRPEAIWKRQVAHFWEINYVIGDPAFLAGRKAWRCIQADAEPGYRCALLPHLQELSGAVGPGERHFFDQFWKKVHESAGQFDLDEGEALSAIGLIKRLYPLLDEFKFLDVASWPSTAWIAATPWLRRIEKVASAPAAEYVKAVKQFERKPFGSTNPAKQLLGAQAGMIARIDGELLFERGIEASLKEHLKTTPDASQLRADINEARNAYKKLTEVGKPIPWYCALAMDGDQIGKLISELDEASRPHLSEALGRFASRVRTVVKKCDGWVVYAGGDDVLALVPAQSALECAQSLRVEYQQAFEEVFSGHSALEWVAISAGLVFADYKVPLRQVLTEAHRLLDQVAKEATGRDAIAISVWLASGTACTWSAPWAKMSGPQADGTDGLLRDLEHCGDSTRVSASFLYGVRESLASIVGTDSAPMLPQKIDLSELLKADLMRICGDKEQVECGRTARALSRLTTQFTRNKARIIEDKKLFRFDGLRLARFMNQVRRPEGVSR